MNCPQDQHLQFRDERQHSIISVTSTPSMGSTFGTPHSRYSSSTLFVETLAAWSIIEELWKYETFRADLFTGIQNQFIFETLQNLFDFLNQFGYFRADLFLRSSSLRVIIGFISASLRKFALKLTRLHVFYKKLRIGFSPPFS